MPSATTPTGVTRARAVLPDRRVDGQQACRGALRLAPTRPVRRTSRRRSARASSTSTATSTSTARWRSAPSRSAMPRRTSRAPWSMRSRRGNVSALSSYREVEVAERLCGIIPCADRVQFLKTGAEAIAAAVRIARTYTARDVVVGSRILRLARLVGRRRGWRARGTTRAFSRVPSTTSPRSRRR